MKKVIYRTAGKGALSGALLIAPFTGVMYLADKLAGLPFVPFDLFDWVTRILPGRVVTLGIDTMRLVGASGSATAKTAEQAIAVLLFLVLGVVMGALLFAVLMLRGSRPGVISGVVGGALAGLPMTAISFAIGGSSVHPVLVAGWLMGLYIAWGVGMVRLYAALVPVEAPVEPAVMQFSGGPALDRRTFLIRVGAATASITVASSGLGYLLAQGARLELDSEPSASTTPELVEGTATPMPNAGDVVVPVPGTRREYTPVESHYKVFLRTRPTVIDGAEWTLPIVGMVKNPVDLTLDDIRGSFTPREQFVTLSCISGRIGTDLIGTTKWTGASLQDILEVVSLEPEARYLHITSGDGFYETVALDLVASDERIMLSYDWDGRPIPIDHGFPLRIWLPDRYGMKQPKWITGIEVSDEDEAGYWVSRGWDAVARVEATSVIDTVSADAAYESDGATLVPVGGIAFAGARGISSVELRVDGGPWQQAQLRTPLSETTWVIWRYDWPFEPGQHNFEVRCADGAGTPQIEEPRGNRPSGATGIHSVRPSFQ